MLLHCHYIVNILLLKCIKGFKENKLTNNNQEKKKHISDVPSGAFVTEERESKNRKMDCIVHGSSTETGISIRIVNKSVIESNRSRKKRKFIKASMEKHK